MREAAEEQIAVAPGPASALAEAELTLAIGEAASAAGVTPGTLRRWEIEGLVAPGRTKGGHRVYRPSDIERARQVAQLRADGLNAVAIARELGPAANPEELTDPDATRIGQKLRTLRQRRGLTLRDVAEAAGVSLSFLSALERDHIGSSMANLFNIAEALGISLPEIGQTTESRPRPLVRPDERERYVSPDGGHTVENLMARPGALEAVMTTIAPGTDTLETYSHGGQEFVFLVSGRLTFWIDDEEYELEPGSALHFSSVRGHRWRNSSSELARVLWVNAPSESLMTSVRRSRDQSH